MNPHTLIIALKGLLAQADEVHRYSSWENMIEYLGHPDTREQARAAIGEYELENGAAGDKGKPGADETAATAKSRVSKITAARLHNLGNYEHVRYEITVEIPDGASAAQALGNVERVLSGLDPKPPVTAYDLQRARAALAKPIEEWPKWERDNVQQYRNYIEIDAAWRTGQNLAREALDDIGGTRIYTDAKDDWDER